VTAFVSLARCASPASVIFSDTAFPLSLTAIALRSSRSSLVNLVSAAIELSSKSKQRSARTSSGIESSSCAS